MLCLIAGTGYAIPQTGDVGTAWSRFDSMTSGVVPPEVDLQPAVATCDPPSLRHRATVVKSNPVATDLVVYLHPSTTSENGDSSGVSHHNEEVMDSIPKSNFVPDSAVSFLQSLAQDCDTVTTLLIAAAHTVFDWPSNTQHPVLAHSRSASSPFGHSGPPASASNVETAALDHLQLQLNASPAVRTGMSAASDRCTELLHAWSFSFIRGRTIAALASMCSNPQAISLCLRSPGMVESIRSVVLHVFPLFF